MKKPPDGRLYSACGSPMRTPACIKYNGSGGGHKMRTCALLGWPTSQY